MALDDTQQGTMFHNTGLLPNINHQVGQTQAIVREEARLTRIYCAGLVKPDVKLDPADRQALARDVIAGLLDMDVGRSSLYRLLDEHFDARPVRAIQSLEPIAARPEEAALLGVTPGEPLMLVERTSWDGRGRAVEHAIDLYRGDRARFVSESRL